MDAQHKIDFARSREERELNQLRKIAELEALKNQERQRKMQDKLERIDHYNDNKSSIIHEREYNVRVKNDESMARAKENDRKIKQRRDNYL